MRTWMRHLTRVVMVLFGLAVVPAGVVDGAWTVTGFGVFLILGAGLWWFADRRPSAPPATAGPAGTALGTVEHGVTYPIPARKRWVLAIGGALTGIALIPLAHAMRADGESMWWFIGGCGLVTLAATPWLVTIARNPSYLAATRSGITFHGAGRTTTVRWDDIVAIDLFEIRHGRGGSTRMLGLACEPDSIEGLRGWQVRLAGWGMRSYGYAQSWPTWQFDATPDEILERLGSYLTDADRRRELDTITVGPASAAHPSDTPA